MNIFLLFISLTTLLLTNPIYQSLQSSIIVNGEEYANDYDQEVSVNGHHNVGERTGHIPGPGEHQVALTADMINVLLNVLSLECKEELERALQTNGQTDMNDKCKDELRKVLVEANAIPPQFKNGNIMGIGASRLEAGLEGAVNSLNNEYRGGGKRNKNKPHKQVNNANTQPLNPFLQFLFHPVTAIVFFVILLLVVALFAVFHINNEMKKRGINLYSKPKKLSKKKEEKMRSKIQSNVIIR